MAVSFMSLAGSAGIAQAAGVKGGEARCLFVSSYHRGDQWSDGIEDGLRESLGERCVLRVFYMDSKRNRAPQGIARAGEQARDVIEQWKPDVVIAADDNAARYLVMPWLRGLDLPVVFCGINWTVEEYGLPYPNATGMVEVAPVASLLDLVRQLLPAARSAMYLGADTLTEGKSLARTREIAQQKGMQLEAALVSTTAQWIEAYRKAQDLDFLIVGDRSGIDNWDPEVVREALLRDTRRISVTSYRAMTPYSMIGYTKVPEEQGEWAGKLAVRILDGGDPADYPVVANRRWDIWINPRLLAAGHVRLPFRIGHGAKWVSGIGR